MHYARFWFVKLPCFNDLGSRPDEMASAICQGCSQIHDGGAGLIFHEPRLSIAYSGADECAVSVLKRRTQTRLAWEVVAFSSFSQ